MSASIRLESELSVTVFESRIILCSYDLKDAAGGNLDFQPITADSADLSSLPRLRSNCNKYLRICSPTRINSMECLPVVADGKAHSGVLSRYSTVGAQISATISAAVSWTASRRCFIASRGASTSSSSTAWFRACCVQAET